jgi:glutamine amidotransferase
MTNVAIVDYGAGNMASVHKALDYCGADVVRVSRPEEIMRAQRLVLPGVGASGYASERLRDLGIVGALTEKVRRQGAPLLGICVGMQLLAQGLHEFGDHAGLGWIEGSVTSLRTLGVERLPVPHMGWNDVTFDDTLSGLGRRLGRHSAFYFAHSFGLDPAKRDVVMATTRYETDLVAAVRIETAVGVQFHPEKSQLSGTLLLEWFLEWRP